MSARFSIRMSFAADAQRVFELVSDPAFLERKAYHFGAKTVDTRVRELEGKKEIEIEVRAPSRWGKREDHWAMTFLYDAQRLEATWVHRVFGLEDRSKVRGEIRVIDHSGTRCDYLHSGTIDISVPLMGGVIERQVKKLIEKNIREERDYIQEMLGARRS